MDRSYKAEDKVSVREGGKVVATFTDKPYTRAGFDNYKYKNVMYPGYVTPEGEIYINLEDQFSQESSMKAIEILLSGAHGEYIPKFFAEGYTGWGLLHDDAKILLEGPENEFYWETWDDVLGYARKLVDGETYTLHQDDDLFAICADSMTNEEYENFFGEMKPAPADCVEYVACSNCLLTLANDDYSGMGDDEGSAVKAGLERESRSYHLVSDGAEYGFDLDDCEICGAPAGNRYRIIGMSKKGEC